MAVEFYLNDELISLPHPRADASVLDFLREMQGLKGSKEGCAEGDCGACTILIGRLKNGAVEYRSLNACIAFLPMIHRTHIVTIEALSKEGTLHDVQKAVMDFHGTQCGFCTPGIVMSLYCAWLNAPQALTYEDWQTALQGNLCRCTGYASILRGVIEGLKNANAANDALMLGKDAMRAKLEAMDASMVAQAGDEGFFIPQNLTELETVACANPQANFVGGATDLGLIATKAMTPLAPLIFLDQVDALKAIETRDDAIQIGAMVNYEMAQAELQKIWPPIEGYWERIASPQIRNMGTLGGNIANGSPIGDFPPVLIALHGRLILNKAGQKREIAAEDYFIDYGKQDRSQGEFIEAIIIPRLPREIYVRKVSKRRDEDISALLGAFSWEMRDGKLSAVTMAFGGMAGIPKRAKNAEAALDGQALSHDIIRKAMSALEKDFEPLSDMRASKDYRMRVAQNLILDAFSAHVQAEAS